MRKVLAIFITLILGASACYNSRQWGDGGNEDGSLDGLPPIPDGGVWPDAAHWWPDANPTDVGPVCPDTGGAIEMYTCDVIAQDCADGMACYGWIEYTEDRCVREIYHTECLQPGFGDHGDSCDSWCQAGLECFVTGEGTQCLYVCDILGGDRLCPPGLICRPTDLPGIGACH